MIIVGKGSNARVCPHRPPCTGPGNDEQKSCGDQSHVFPRPCCVFLVCIPMTVTFHPKDNLLEPALLGVWLNLL